MVLENSVTVTIEEKKKFLRRHRNLDGMIRLKELEIEQLRDFAQRITTIASDLPKPPSPGNTIERNMIRLIQMENEIIEDINKLIDMQYDLRIKINNIDVPDNSQLTEEIRSVMRLYYVDGLTWEKVMVEINLPWMTMHRRHSRGLDLG